MKRTPLTRKQPLHRTQELRPTERPQRVQEGPLTWDIVRELRRVARTTHRSERRLAREFGISRDSVHRILAGTAWVEPGVDPVRRPTTKKLSLADREEIQRRYREGESQTSLARAFGVAQSRISTVMTGRGPDYARKARHGAFGLQAKGESACRNCGGTRGLGLHHILPRSFYRPGRDDIRNGVPLCGHCHLGWHHRRVALYRDIFTADEWAYISSVKLTGQEIGPWLDERYPEPPAVEVAA